MNKIDSRSVMKFAMLMFTVSMLYVSGVTFFPLPESGEDTAKYVTGFLIGTGVGSIVSYYWGGAIKKTGQGEEKKEG